MRAWRDLPGLRDPDRIGPWLHRLTVNACLDLTRRRRRRTIEVELTSLDHPSVPDTATQVADRDVLDRALARLEPEQRAVVVLRFFLGLSLPETAVALGIPIGTVKSRLHRSLAQMRITVTSDDVIPGSFVEGLGTADSWMPTPETQGSKPGHRMAPSCGPGVGLPRRACPRDSSTSPPTATGPSTSRTTRGSSRSAMDLKRRS